MLLFGSGRLLALRDAGEASVARERLSIGYFPSIATRLAARLVRRECEEF